jgi:tryptophan-rich sensory protein
VSDDDDRLSIGDLARACDGARAAAGLVVLLLPCLGIGAIGSLANATSSRTWCPSLARPSWTPPDAVFGPVWTCPYAALAAASP